MGITTLVGVLSGLQPPVYFSKLGQTNAANGMGKAVSEWGQGGFPGVGTLSASLNGAALTGPVAGQFAFTNPPSGNAYLARLELACNNIASGNAWLALLCDRLWHNGGIDQTGNSPGGAQAITFPGLPSRDVFAAANGDGVFIALEQNSAMVVSGTPTVSISYTNSAGVSGLTASPIQLNFLNTSSGASFLFGLNPGDTGVQSVQSITVGPSSWTSGTLNLAAYRIITALSLGPTAYPSAMDAINGCLPLIQPNSVPYLMQICGLPAAGPAALTGQLQYTWG